MFLTSLKYRGRVGTIELDRDRFFDPIPIQSSFGSSDSIQSNGSPTVRRQILNIRKVRNLSIWLIDLFQISPMKLVYSAIDGFDWELVSNVVSIMQIFRICLLRVTKPYDIANIDKSFCRNFFRYWALSALSGKK